MDGGKYSDSECAAAEALASLNPLRKQEEVNSKTEACVPPPKTGIPPSAAVQQGDPASSKVDLTETKKMAKQKDYYVDTLLADNEYLNEVSLGYSPETNLKQPFKGFNAETQRQFFPLIDIQAAKLFAIVQKKNDCQKKSVMAAIRAKKGVIKVFNGTKVRSYLCHKTSVEQANQGKSATMESMQQVDNSEEMESTQVVMSEEMESTQVDKPEETENTQVDKPEETENTQVDKAEETESTQVDKPEEIESTQVVKSEETVSTQVDKPEEMESTQASTPSPRLLELEDRFGEEKLLMLREVLDAGWKREIVMRSPKSSGRKTGDVYYHSPEGHKFRTSKQLEKYLVESNSPFTTANFSYAKFRISENPEQEIMRTAYEGIKSPLSSLPKLAYSKDKAPLPPSPPTSIASVQYPPMKGRRSIQPSTGYSGDVMRLPKRSLAEEEKFWSKNAEMLMGLLPPNWPNEVEESPGKLNVKRKMQTLKKSAQTSPCSIGCPGMEGVVPNLQCTRCRCLFHMKCVGLRANIAYKNYFCLNCVEENFGKGPSFPSPSFQQEPMMMKTYGRKMIRPPPELAPMSYGDTRPVTMAAKVGSRSVPQKIIGNEPGTSPGLMTGGVANETPPKKRRGRPPKYPEAHEADSALAMLQSSKDLTITKFSKVLSMPNAANEAPFPFRVPALPKYMNPNAFKKLGVPLRSSGGSTFRATVPPSSDHNEHEQPSLVKKRYPQTVCEVGGRKFIVLPKRGHADFLADIHRRVAAEAVTAGDVEVSEEIVEDGSFNQFENNDSTVTMDDGGGGGEQVNNCNGGEANDNLVNDDDDSKMDYGWLF